MNESEWLKAQQQESYPHILGDSLGRSWGSSEKMAMRYPAGAGSMRREDVGMPQVLGSPCITVCFRWRLCRGDVPVA